MKQMESWRRGKTLRSISISNYEEIRSKRTQQRRGKEKERRRRCEQDFHVWTGSTVRGVEARQCEHSRAGSMRLQVAVEDDEGRESLGDDLHVVVSEHGCGNVIGV